MEVRLHFLVWAICLGVASSQEFECPRNATNYCIEDTYPMEGECEYYYVCTSCQAIIERCTVPGNHYNYNLGFCTDPANARCDPTFINGSLFCAAGNTGTVSGPASNVPLPNVLANYVNSYDSLSSSMLTSQQGQYFFHLSAGIERNEPLNCSIRNSPDTIDVFSSSKSHGVYQQTRDLITEVTPGKTLSVSLTAESILSTTDSMWLGFRLQDYMQADVVAFSAVNRVDLNPSNADIIFETELVDTTTTDAYDQSNGKFTAPADGIYVFSFSAGVYAISGIEASFYTNTDVTSIYCRKRDSSSIEEIDTISKTIVHEMTQGDTMSIRLGDEQTIAGKSNLLSFSGFQYKPITGTETAWFAYIFTQFVYQAPLDPLIFDLQPLALPAGIINSDGVVTAPVSGYYFVTMTGCTFNLANIDMPMIHTGEAGETEVMKIYRANAPSEEWTTIGRSAVVYMRQGDTLRVVLREGSLYNIDFVASFGGFLLMEIVL